MRRALVSLVLAVVATAALPAAASAARITSAARPRRPRATGGTAQPVTVHWEWLPTNATVLGGCDNNDPVDFDTAVTFRYCKVGDGNGLTDAREVSLQVDMTPPVVTAATPSRPPDANGWYRSPFQVAFSGTDATSGLAGCTSATYGGPDSASATVTGTCTDKAGNVSTAGAFALRYDATAPTINGVRVVPGDRIVRLRWATADATAVELWRSPGIKGEPQSLVNSRMAGSMADRQVRNGRRYDYRLTAVDEAGNVATRTFSARPGRRLLAPAAGHKVDRPPLLRWTEIRRAGYYNVQLFRGDRKVLSAWPRRPRLKLQRAWRFEGERFRLVPGRRYRWLVWPGRGKRSLNKYGPLIGSGSFTLASP